MNRFMELYEQLTREYAEEGIFAGGFSELEEFMKMLSQKLNYDEAFSIIKCLMSKDELMKLIEEHKEELKEVNENENV
jgi:Trp operon repressor